ncbi:MAG: class I SAM-dependent methyltransferase, partial [Prochlorococcaceae cyanobacterium]
MPTELAAYLRSGINQVEGWCNPELWQLLEPIVAIQIHQQSPSAIAEIGVYHGKFFIGLALSHPGGPHLAIDCFDDQQFNIDGAGIGHRETFLANCRTHGVPPEQVQVLQANSLDLPKMLGSSLFSGLGMSAEGGRPFSIFSIDGCHTVEHTHNDLLVACQLTNLNHGVILVDDYTNPDWPGVQEAVARFYLFGAPTFAPLAVTCNKLLLVPTGCHTPMLDACT